MPSHLRFNDDKGLDTYDPSESDDDYTENEKRLLKKVRNRKKEYSDSEDEVFGVGSNEEDSDDNKSDLALSDVEGQEDEDDLPDARAWGKEKRKYYSTDYVDQDYGGFQGKDAHLAELEEEEARTLQKQLAQQLDDDDFSLDFLSKATEEDKKETEEIIKTDISKLSKRQKLQILKKESPEFFGLVEDFEAKLTVAKEFLYPILQKYKSGKIPNCRAIDFVQTQHELILNYCTNIYIYLLLKSARTNVQHHPVIKRLYQYRQLLSQMEPVYEDIIKPQISIILQEMETNDGEIGTENRKEKKRALKFLATLTKKDELKKKKVQFAEADEEQPTKKIKLDEEDGRHADKMKVVSREVDSAENEEGEENTADQEESVNNENENEVTKRAITYKMAKNKGLTPHRKKEQRNPRVKHKLKYRKAIIRRKGAVREPRKELSRYSGEISGIKASVSKSIKIKT